MRLLLLSNGYAPGGSRYLQHALSALGAMPGARLFKRAAPPGDIAPGAEVSDLLRAAARYDDPAE